MTSEQGMAFAVLGLALVLFAWGRWRYDVVAVACLLVSVAMGLVPYGEAFGGFSHPAVITVAAVLIISRGLQNAGIVDAIVKLIKPLGSNQTVQIAAQCSIIAVLSSFMNNIGALALMLPVALRNAYRGGYSPANSLMPLAFASLLGGLMTLIGTPPNIIVSGFRAENGGGPFAMFDFARAGLPVAAAGLIFLILFARHLIPKERANSGSGDAFSIADYIAELHVPAGAKSIGMTVQEVELAAEYDVSVAGVGRNDRIRLLPAAYQRFEEGDIVLVSGDVESIKMVMDATGMTIAKDKKYRREDLKSEKTAIVEVAIASGSSLIGGTAVSARLRQAHGINLLALARQGAPMRKRLGHVTFRAGDVLMLQGDADSMTDTLGELQLVPLAERNIDIARQRKLFLASGLFGISILSVLSGLLPVQIAFTAAALAFALVGIVPADEMYKAIDWPVIVLLGALFPVGAALEATGGTALIADGVLRLTAGLGSFWVIAFLLVATMFISDIINNNATAVLMAPIAVTLSSRLGANPDPFLMAVAIGASCAFLTPVGHQSNTLVMEPGGYKFGDYWRVGLPLEAIVALAAIPAITIFWPP